MILEFLTALQERNEPWRAQRACANMDPRHFVLDRGGSSKKAYEACGRCPVREECYAFACSLEPGAVGIWGGVYFDGKHRVEPVVVQDARPVPVIAPVPRVVKTEAPSPRRVAAAAAIVSSNY